MLHISERSLEEQHRDAITSMGGSTDLGDKQSHVKKKPSFHARFHGGWRTGVAWGAVGAVLVLVINMSFLISIRSRFLTEPNGETIIHEGSCETKTGIFRWSHLLINLCGTLLLSASNNAMQCLSAPTRAEIDRAHRRKLWLDIGIQSVRNLIYVGRVRSMLWTALLLSSVPLHLL